MPPIYEPQEDSFMLAEQVKIYAKGLALDIGTGTGIQVSSALENKNVQRVYGVDIDKNAVEFCKKNIKSKKAEFFVSDLFEYFRKKNKRFDTIIFNPPYLPSKIGDLTLEGGKKGYEVIERFLSEANEFLKPDGNILIVFSSLTKKDEVDKLISNNLLEFQLLDTRHIFFEDIYVYLIRKSELLKKIDKLGISGIKYLTRGKRGIIYTGILRKKKVAIKCKRTESMAVGRIKNERNLLKRLNKLGIAPKLIYGSDEFFVSEFIDGKFILDYIKCNNKKNIRQVIKKILEQLYQLDKIHIAKEEMHRPLKHIIITKYNPFLIDFERAHYSKKPKNVTQFCEFLIRTANILKEKGISIDKNRVIELAKRYKTSPTRRNYNLVVELLC